MLSVDSIKLYLFFAIIIPITANSPFDKLSEDYHAQPVLSSIYDPKYPTFLRQQENINVPAELAKLNTTYKWQDNWPKKTKDLGQVSAVAFDNDHNIVVFHRADRVWNSQTFNRNNIFQERALGPIPDNTIVAFDRNTGTVSYEFGRLKFYMPHGLTIDHEGNYWVTDVALHVVMKFPTKSVEKPSLTLGIAFQPGNSPQKFCKPTSVAVLPDGDFFVADGYCNSRIIKYSKAGEILLVWGQNSFQGDAQPIAPQNFFAIPHALTLAMDLGLICVADRENGRVQCFHIENGMFHSQYFSPIIGNRLFGVSYAPINGGQLFVINGPELSIFGQPEKSTNVLGFVIDMTTKKVLSKFGLGKEPFQDPHDIKVSPDGKEVYVAELMPNCVYKLIPVNQFNQTKIISSNVKPTATIDNPLSPQQTAITITKVEPGATALLVVSLIVIFSILTFGLALLISRRRKRGCLQIGTKNRRHAWDFPTVVKSDSFKLGNLLDRKRGFEKLNQEASDEEPNASTTMLSSNSNSSSSNNSNCSNSNINSSNAQFA